MKWVHSAWAIVAGLAITLLAVVIVMDGRLARERLYYDRIEAAAMADLIQREFEAELKAKDLAQELSVCQDRLKGEKP